MQTQQAEIDVAVNSNAIYFIDAQRGWAVGSSGTILLPTMAARPGTPQNTKGIQQAGIIYCA